MTNNASNNLAVNYSLNTGNLWLNCNYPETLKNASLANSGKCLNKVDVNAGTHQIFFSYQGGSGADEVPSTTALYFSIMVVKRAGTDAISFTNLKQGIRTSKNYGTDWSPVNSGSWEDYFASTAKPSVVLKNTGDFGWLVQDFAKESGAKLISGNVQFSITGGATVYIFAHTNTSFTNCSSLSPYEKPSSENNGMYSGYAYGYKYTANITLDANTLPTTANIDKKFLLLNYPTDSRLNNVKINSQTAPNNSDLIELNLNTTPSRKINAGTSNHNLGNWGAMYEYTFTFTNSDTNNPKTVNFYYQSDTSNVGEYPVIQYVQSGVSKVLWPTGSNVMKCPSTGCWNFFTAAIDKSAGINGIPAATQTFCYILGPNSCSKKMMFLDRN